MNSTKIAVHEADSLADTETPAMALANRRPEHRIGRRRAAKSRRSIEARRSHRAFTPTAAEEPTTSDAPPSDGARQLEKLKHFLATLQHLARDVSPCASEYVRSLVAELLDAHITAEEFHGQLIETINFPLKPYVVPFLKSTLPALRAELGRRHSPPQPLTPTEKRSVFATGGGLTPPAVFSPPLRSSEEQTMQEVRLATPKPWTRGPSFKTSSSRVHPYAKRETPLPSTTRSTIASDDSAWKTESPTLRMAREHAATFSDGELSKRIRRRGSECSERLSNSEHELMDESKGAGFSFCEASAVAGEQNRTADHIALPLWPSQSLANRPWRWPPEKVALIYAAMHGWEDKSSTQKLSDSCEDGKLPGNQSFIEQWLSIQEMINCVQFMVEGVQQLISILRDQSARPSRAAYPQLNRLRGLSPHRTAAALGTYSCSAKVDSDFLGHGAIGSTAATPIQGAADSGKDCKTGCCSGGCRATSRLTCRSCTPTVSQLAGLEKQTVQRQFDATASALTEAIDVGRTRELLLSHKRKDVDHRRSRVGAVSTEIAQQKGSCWRCGRRTDKMCSNCCTARYCSSLCQRKDWPSHSRTCLANPAESQAKGLKASSASS